MRRARQKTFDAWRLPLYGRTNLIAAWILGWIIYMIAMMLTVYEGIESLIFQPFIGAFMSTVFLLAATSVGVLFRIPSVASVWKASWRGAGLVALAGASALCFGGLNPMAASAGYFLVIFSIVNWPAGPRKNCESEHTDRQ